MKSDLDQLMQQQGFDAILITGPAQHNPMMTYFLGAVHVTDADLFLRPGLPAELFCPPMEREEGARSGIKTTSFAKYPMFALAAETGGDFVEAYALRYEKVLREIGLTSGLVALYGLKDVGLMHSVLSRVEKRLPGLHFEGFIRDEIMLQAMMTKDEAELEHIRRMGIITTDVVSKTADFICGHKVRNEALIHSDGTPLTIGEVHKRINLWLAEAGAENPEGTIFAQGRDAGVPHSMGNDAEPIRLGRSIVFDIFPCEAGGGYFYDFTRTWCLGYAPDDVLKLHEDVKSVYDQLVGGLKTNMPFCDLQTLTCDLFEKQGHPTLRQNDATESGYVHSVGHGIGLQVHEKPWSTLLTPSPTDVLSPGAVFTLEPGLYYPERGMGVRIEDSYAAKADGSFELLAHYPDDLVLPVK